MEKIPNYSNYTLDQLYDVYHHVDRDKYPDIYNRVIEEIQKRKDLISPPDISFEETFFDLRNISNIETWFKELIERGIYLNDILKSLISQLFPFLKFESQAIFSVKGSKLSITFSPIKKGPIYFASTYLLLLIVLLLYSLMQLELPSIFLSILFIIPIIAVIRINRDIKNYIRKIEIIFFENSRALNIPIQLIILSQNNRKRKMDLSEIRKFKMLSMLYIFFPSYRAQFKAKLKSGGKLNLGYFVSKDIVRIMCNYFNDQIHKY